MHGHCSWEDLFCLTTIAMKPFVERLGSGKLLFALIFLTNLTLTTYAQISLDLPASPDNYIPRSRPDFNLADIPCDLKESHVCTRAGKVYPWYGMQNYIQDNRAMIKRLYGLENKAGPSLNHAQGPIIPLRSGRASATNACPSEQVVVTPFWANNSDGTTLALVNFHPFEQAIQQETCKTGVQGRCRDGCQCEQKYAWYRLLAFDPRNECKGIFMDWFQFPSCCACNCYDNGSHEFSLPTTTASPNVQATSEEQMTPKLLNITSPSQTESPLVSASLHLFNSTLSSLTTESLISTPILLNTTISNEIPTTLPSKVIVTSDGTSSSNSNSSSPKPATMTQSSSLAPATVINASLNFTGTPIARSLPLLEYNSSAVTGSPTGSRRATISPAIRSRFLSISQIKTRSTVPPVGSAGSVTVTSSSSIPTSSTPVSSSTTTVDTSSLLPVPWYDNVLPTMDQDQINENIMKVIDVAIRRNRIPRI